jgi:hypothetical protein
MKSKMYFTLFIGLFCLCSVALAGGPQTVRVIQVDAVVHLDPDIESRVLMNVPPGAALNVVEKAGEWFKVSLPPDDEGIVVTGYIHENAVEMIAVEPAGGKQEQIETQKPADEEPVQRQPVEPRRRQAPGFSGMKKLSFGAAAGVSMSNLSGDTVQEWEDLYGTMDSKTAITAGGFILYRINRSIAVQPGVYYMQKGGTISGTISGMPVEAAFNLSYLEIPVLVNVYFSIPGPLNPFITAGPVVALKAGAESEITFMGETTTETMDDVKGTDFGLAFGSGLEFNLGPGTLQALVRYTTGLTNISDEPETEIKNGTFAVLVGFIF